MFYVTFPDQETATSFADRFVDDGAAACATLLESTSIYRWEGDVQREDEVVALWKVADDQGDAFRERMVDEHPYDVPCVVELPAGANAAYEGWVAEAGR